VVTCRRRPLSAGSFSAIQLPPHHHDRFYAAIDGRAMKNTSCSALRLKRRGHRQFCRKVGACNFDFAEEKGGTLPASR